VGLTATQSHTVNTWYRFLQFGSSSSRNGHFSSEATATNHIYIYIYIHTPTTSYPLSLSKSLSKRITTHHISPLRPMMDYACPIWRSAACSHLRKLHVIQSKCLRIATGAPWYISNVQIHDDLGVPFFAEHIRALTESYDSKLAGVGNPLVQQLGRHLR
jgi:hypothetical protein